MGGEEPRRLVRRGRGAAGVRALTPAAEAVERAARDSFGRLVAYLAARSGDLAGAKDALADALLAALQRWPEAGVPRNPEAWLLTVARRRLLDRHRHRTTVAGMADALRLAQDEAEAAMAEQSDFADERLKLLFACAHPAVDAGARTPLMLQMVLGLNAERIASAFLASPAAMTKRLTRAKLKIRDAGVAFAIPAPAELPGRLGAVLQAVYAAYTLGWNDPAGADRKREGLAQEAIWLGRVLLALLPDAAEVRGLLALMLFCESRNAARRDPAGRYVPLGQQDSALWSEAMIAEAETLLRAAGRQGSLGPYQLEAAIHAVHAARRVTGSVDWPTIAQLYEGLVVLSPTAGARVGWAAALCESGEPQAALAAIEAIEAPLVATYQPFWATHAHVCERLGHPADAAVSFTRAIGLSEDAAVRAYLMARRTALTQ